MASINMKRVYLGALAGGVVWTLWGFLISVLWLEDLYMKAQEEGQFLAEPRYGFFVPVWILTIFLLSCTVSWLYAAARTTLGPGPKSAALVGAACGFLCVFPWSFSMSTWGTFPRIIPFFWVVDLGLGCIIAALVAGWVYRES